MTGQTIRIRIAGTLLDVPVFQDETRTLELVEKVNERFREIEAASSRIDTQVFALQTAFSFAAELEHLTSEREEEVRELVSVLAEFAGRLETLVQQHYTESQG